MKWFKFYGQDYLSDPKMLALSASERSCWITILSYASVNDNGMITFLSEQQVMIQAGVDPMSEEWKRAKGVLDKLIKLEMITVSNDTITVSNWRKRQETSLTSYERVKRFREKKRIDNENDNAMITLEEKRVINDNPRKEKKRYKTIAANAAAIKNKPQDQPKNQGVPKTAHLDGDYDTGLKNMRKTREELKERGLII